jgi:hypothetical protein
MELVDLVQMARGLAVAALLPGLVSAADPALLNLIMPEARGVAEIDVARMVASPLGQSIAAELARNQGRWQSQVNWPAFDVSQYVQDVVVAIGAGSGKDTDVLLLIRGSLPPELRGSMEAHNGRPIEYQGVRIIPSAQGGNGVMAFLDDSLVVAGQTAAVKGAIDRWRRGTNVPPGLAAKLRPFVGQYDLWVATTGPFATPDFASAAKIEGFHGGIRFSPDFDLSAEIDGRTEQDTAAMANAIQGFLKSFANNGRQANTGLENLQYKVDGKRLLVSLQVPEAELRAALKRGLQSGATARAAGIAPRTAPRFAPSGPPPPPPGTIRIQSSPSDMGTVLLPTDKQP